MFSAISRSIRRKLMLVVLATTIAALLVAAAALILYDLRSYRQTSIDNLTTQAEILARATAPALAFNDVKSAQEDLLQLRARPQILAAAIYQPNGRLFASFSQGDEASLIPAIPEQGRLAHRRRPAAALPSDPREGRDARHRLPQRALPAWTSACADYLVIVAVVMAGSFGVALLISVVAAGRAHARRSSRSASVAREVVERRDYSLKARKTTDDEIGDLVDAFNAMLLEVGRRESALRGSGPAQGRVPRHARARAAQPAGAAHATRCEILRLAGADEATRAKAREIMERQLRQMVRLVDDLLDVSRITTGKLALAGAAPRAGAR